MKTYVRSLGSLGALAAFCAGGAVRAAVITSTGITDIPITDNSAQSLDIDGNGSTDFLLFANSGYIGLNDGGAGNTVAVSSTVVLSGHYVQVLNNGDAVGPALSYNQPGYLYDANDINGSPAGSGTFAVGFQFAANDSLTHYGWFTFSFPNGAQDPFNNSVLVSASWEDQANTSVSIVAVPEPGALTMAGITALAFVAGGVWARVRQIGRAHV
jgi:hypothetical protein